MGTGARVVASALRRDAALGPPQSGTSRTLPKALVRSRPGGWPRPAGRIPGTRESAPDRAVASRKAAARTSRGFARTSRHHVVRMHGTLAGAPRGEEADGTNAAGVCGDHL